MDTIIFVIKKNMNQFKNPDIRIAKNLIGDIDYVDNDFIVLDDLSKFNIPNDSPIRLGDLQ